MGIAFLPRVILTSFGRHLLSSCFSDWIEVADLQDGALTLSCWAIINVKLSKMTAHKRGGKITDGLTNR